MELVKEKRSRTYFYIAGALATAVVSIGGYYLYKYFTYDDINELIDDSMLQSITELIPELKAILKGGPNAQAGEIAFRITNEINTLSLKYYALRDPDQDVKRRKAIDNTEQYKALCYETLELKEECILAASKKVLELLDDVIDLDKIEQWITMIEPLKLEEYSNKYSNVTLKEPVPSIEFLKEVYTFYADLLKEEHECLFKTQSEMQSNKNNEEGLQTDELIFHSMVIKLKVDDKIFIKYNMTEESLRYGLKERNLFNDPDILKIQDNLKKLLPMPMMMLS